MKTNIGDLERNRVSIDDSDTSQSESLLVQLRVPSTLDSVVGSSLLEVGIGGLRAAGGVCCEEMNQTKRVSILFKMW